ncbi:YfhO family protein [Butyrivibrio sp.]|uniref:YfhO family protein n=1 Tax=Butyrivibrio sp. TaxID=28121 RepID=UPI0025C349E0|nr:YfhO family protein [Butyrivibrio sp.]MBE5837194.1 hypothetical protein [Butyrivibrio sp.]
MIKIIINKCKLLQPYMLLTVLVSTIYLMVCARHHIYPFGNSTVAREDFAGMIVPSYTFIWDVMHGKASLFWDWYTGLGQNMMGVVVHFDLLSPFNLLFFLWDRSELKYMMTYFIMIKIIFISWSMFYFLNKVHYECKLGIMYSLLYAFSGFVLQNMETPSWLEAVMLYPMLLLGINDIIQRKKWIKYSIVLTMIFILSIEQSYMFVLSIILLIFAYLIFVSRKEQGAIIICLAIGTMISFMIAAPIFIPGAYQVVNSYRLASRNSFWDIMNTVDYSNRFKWLMLVNMSIPASVILMYLIENRKIIKEMLKNKRVQFYIFIAFVFAMPILVEASNIMWSAGSYVNFPMRYAYMLETWILFISFLCYKRLKLVFCDNKLLLLCAVAVQPFFLCMEHWILTNNKGMAWIAILLAGHAISVIPLMSKHSNWKCIFLGTLILAQCLILLNVYLLPFKHEDTPSLLSFEEYEELSGSIRKPVERVKCYDGNQDSNYPVLIRRAAQSSYMHLVSKEQIRENKMLGYANIYTRLSDVGGTVFSDMVIGVKDVFSKKENILPSKLYRKIGENEHFNIYQTKYQYDEGILIDENTVRDINEGSIIYNQNCLAHMILGVDLFTSAESMIKGNEIDIRINGEKCLYYYNENEGNVSFEVNGQQIEVYDRNGKNTFYPSSWNNGCVLLGVFKDEVVKIIVNGEQAYDADNFFTLDMDLLAENEPYYAESYKAKYSNNSISIYLENKKDGKELFLPISADKGWTCIVNGNLSDVEKVYNGAFIGIPLKYGKNEIKLYFIPVGFKVGVALLLLTIMIITLAIINRFDYRVIVRNQILQRIAIHLFYIISMILLFVIYICPALGFVYSIVGALF